MRKGKNELLGIVGAKNRVWRKRKFLTRLWIFFGGWGKVSWCSRAPNSAIVCRGVGALFVLTFNRMNVKIVGYCVLVSMVLRNTVSFTTQDSGALLTTIFIRDCWSCVGQGSLSLVGWVVLSILWFCLEYFVIKRHAFVTNSRRKLNHYVTKGLFWFSSKYDHVILSKYTMQTAINQYSTEVVYDVASQISLVDLWTPKMV